MIKYFLRFYFLSIALILCACTNYENSSAQGSIISGAKILSSNSPAPQKATELANAAENLFAADGIKESHDLALQALHQDATNEKAGFIKVITEAILIQKGIFTRVLPLFEHNMRIYNIYGSFADNYERNWSEALINFLRDGKPDIKSENDLQKHLDLTIQSLDKIRLFAKNNKDQELTIKANSFLVPDLIERYANACEIKTLADLTYQVSCPDANSRFNITLNRADFEQIQHTAAFWMVYATVANAYDLSGTFSAFNINFNQGELSPQQILDKIFQNKNFGHLRPKAKQQLQAVKEMGVDLLGGIDWAMSQQSKICPLGKPDPNNLPGHLMNTGYCTTPEFKAMRDMLDLILSGKSVDLTVGTNTPYTTQYTAIAFFDNPVTDLRKLGPIKINSCMQLESVGDPTFGGIFPKGDANIILKNIPQNCGY